MPTPSLTPPRHHGTGLWIAAILLMLGAIGGLLYWRFGKPAEDHTSAAGPLPSVAPSAEAPVFETAPPPPPPEEPDAGGEPVKKRATASGGCSGTCGGHETAALVGFLRGTARSAQGCYERALRQNATLQGKIVVAVRVGPNGASCGASLVSDGLRDTDVTGCVLAKFRSGTFPAPVGGCVDVQVPMSFMPKTP